MSKLWLGLIGIGIVLFILGTVATAPLSVLASSYSVCNVTAQNGIVVTACSGQVIGPEPDGSTIWLVTVSVLGGGCTANYVWTFSPPFVMVAGGVAQANFPNVPYSASTSFTVVNGAYSASGNIIVYSTSGTSSFTNNQGQSYASCTVTTTTSTSTSSTSLTKTFTYTTTTTSGSTTITTVTSTTTTIGLGPSITPPQGNQALMIIGLFFVGGGVALKVGQKGRK